MDENKKNYNKELELNNNEDFKSKKMFPTYEALKISIIYGIFGLLWIYMSDDLLIKIVDDTEKVKQISIFKGWFYVFITMCLLYILVKRKMTLLNHAQKEIRNNYNELISTYEELKLTEEELRSQLLEIEEHRNAIALSENKYKLAVEGANDGIWEWDIENDYYFTSLVRKERFGYKQEDFNNKLESFKKIVYFEDRELLDKSIKELISSDRTTSQFIFRVKTKDDSIRWILSKGHVLRDEAGKPVRAAGSHTDITSQIELQELLRQEKEFSEGILNNASSIIIVLNKDGIITTFNKFAEKITGYNSEEMLGHNWSEISYEHKKDCECFINNINFGNISLTDEKRLLCKNGKVIDVLWNNSMLYNEDGTVYGIVMIGNDITEKKKMEEKLYNMAHYDSLTGLPNRVSFEKEFVRVLDECNNSDFKVALLYFDVDNFKFINDTLGHFSGDKLLKYISNILDDVIKPPNTIARLGGDEFAILLVDIENKEEILKYINLIFKKFNKPWVIENQEFLITISMGVALSPEHSCNSTDLLKYADSALFAVKEVGKNGYKFYNSTIEEKTLKYISIINEIRQALKNNEFVLYYQPLIDLRTTRIIGAEALIRWNHPTRGFISPAEFIPIAEESGLILDIDKWVFETACMNRKKWEEEGLICMKMSINLSTKRLNQKNLIKYTEEFIKNNSLNTSQIQLEITETAAMDNYEDAIYTLTKLRKIGFQIALDDFGNGFSSLNYLMKLPIDTIKIDREYIKNILYDKEKEIIVRGLIGMAHDLDLKIVAEGIESYEQKEYLKLSNCDIGQGYLFGKPMPEEELMTLLKNN